MANLNYLRVLLIVGFLIFVSPVVDLTSVRILDGRSGEFIATSGASVESPSVTVFSPENNTELKDFVHIAGTATPDSRVQINIDFANFYETRRKVLDDLLQEHPELDYAEELLKAVKCLQSIVHSDSCSDLVDEKGVRGILSCLGWCEEAQALIAKIEEKK